MISLINDVNQNDSTGISSLALSRVRVPLHVGAAGARLLRRADHVHVDDAALGVRLARLVRVEAGTQAPVELLAAVKVQGDQSGLVDIKTKVAF